MLKVNAKANFLKSFETRETAFTSQTSQEETADGFIEFCEKSNFYLVRRNFSDKNGRIPAKTLLSEVGTQQGPTLWNIKQNFTFEQYLESGPKDSNSNEIKAFFFILELAS